MKALKALGIATVVMCLVVCFPSCSDDDDSSVGIKTENSVTLKKAGTLRELLGDEVQTITSLKVSGPINGDDIVCLRQMLGCTDEDVDTRGVLAVLDLSGATITEGGEPYNMGYYTSKGRIGRYMFYRCEGLERMVLPSNVTSIGSFALANCAHLTQVTIPKGVTSIEEAALYACAELTDVTFPEGITEMSPSVLGECAALKELTIPNGVTKIGTSAFYRCLSLTEVTIPNSVTSIATSAFYRCSSLVQVTIPESVTSIGNEAFWACSGLTEVTIGRGVTSIGGMAFWNCTGLTSVTSLNPVPPACGMYVFLYVPTSDCVLLVPSGAKDAYATANGWADFDNIVEASK